ncbi:MAG: tetratricopeptide repeat protein [Acidobacteria bacterium]|nr:tetratricopeptide repeat protein [Acidobacteriota bacterium]
MILARAWRHLVLAGLGSFVGLAGLAQPPPASDDFRSQHALGEALIRQNKLAAAIPYLARAQRIDPAHYVNSWDLALCYFQTGDLAAARRQILAVLERKDTGELHNLLGDLEEKAGNTVEAAKQYQAAARMEPNEKHLASWANHLLRYRAYQPALQVYRRAVELHPRSSQLRIGLGVAYYSTGEYDEAVQSLCAGIDLDPVDPRPIFFLGKMLDVSPQLAGEVTRRFAYYAKLYPKNALAQYYYGVSLWKQAHGQPDTQAVLAAEKHLKSAAALDPNLAEARLQLGILCESQGRDADAIQALRQALRIDPSLETAHYRLGRLYQRTGQADLSRKELEIHARLRQQSKTDAEKKQAEAKALVVE